VFTTLANLIDMSIHPSVTLDTAEGYAQAAVELAERLNAPEELSDALEALGKVYFVRGRLPDQLEVSHRRLALSRDPRFRDLLKQVNILESLSDALMAVGEYEQAMHHLLENEALAIQIDAVAAQVWAMGLQALCLFRLDRWEELFELDERLRELERRYSLNQIGGGNCVVISICAAAHALRGDLNKAQVMREQAYAFMTRGGWDSPEDWERTQFY
jgi:tetratricopeptide (TPR) repeat protein